MNAPRHHPMLRRLLAVALPPARRDTIIADLDREYLEDVSLRMGPVRARLWYHRETSSLIRWYGWERICQLYHGRSRRNPNDVPPGPRASLRRGRGLRRQGESVLFDLTFGWRSLRKTPLFTTIAVATIGFAIGANVIVFSAADVYLFRPLPYEEAQRLVDVFGVYPPMGWDHIDQSLPDFLDIRETSRTMDVAAWRPRNFNLSGGDRPVRAAGAIVSWNFFQVLRARPALGRTFASDEEAAGSDRVIIISDGLWQRQFGSDSAVVGRQIPVDGETVTIIGVMPPHFSFGFHAHEIWRPLGLTGREGRGSHNAQLFGRLRAGYSADQASEEVSRIAAALESSYPETNTAWSAGARPLRDGLVDEGDRAGGIVLFAVSAFVLLIACANVAGLMLARATGRGREIAVRAAIGAGRMRIVRQLFTESAIIAVLGAALGVLITAAGIEGLTAIAGAESQPGLPSVNGRVFGFALGLSGLTAVLFGSGSSLLASTPDLTRGLKEGCQTFSSPKGGALRRALVIAQVTLALPLLIVSVLLTESFVKLQQVDHGWNSDGVLTVRFDLPAADYPTAASIFVFQDNLLEEVAALPDVQRTAGINMLPLTGMDLTVYTVADDPATLVPPYPSMSNRQVFPGYEETMGVRLLSGRTVRPSDRADTEPVVVINEAFKTRHWPDDDPIGKRISFWGEDWSVVGVVANTLDDLGRAEPTVFWSAFQIPIRSMALTVRTAGNPTALAEPITAIFAELDANLPTYHLMTMRDIEKRSRDGIGIVAASVILAAAIALALAMMGVYGVIAYTVTRRTGELGIRLALGAQRRELVTMFVKEGARLAVGGVVLGVAAGAGIARLLASVLVNVNSYNPLVFGGSIVVVLCAGLAASFLPARRGARLDPTNALRHS